MSAVDAGPALILNTALLGDVPIGDKIDLAARHGFAGVEVWIHEVAPQLLVDTDPAALRARYGISAAPRPVDAHALAARIRGHGLLVTGVVPGIDAMTRWTSNLDGALLATFDASMQVCAALGGDYLVLPTIAETGSQEDVAASLGRLAPLAERHGIRLALEPIGQTPVMPTVAAALSVLDTAKVGDRAGLLLDSFHFFRAAQSPDTLCLLDPARIVAVQINDAVAKPLDRLEGGRHRTLPGKGMFDVAGFCAAILACGYTGPFTVEVMNPDLAARPAAMSCAQAKAAASAVLAAAAGRPHAA